jgi:hypothetical protein
MVIALPEALRTLLVSEEEDKSLETAWVSLVGKFDIDPDYYLDSGTEYSDDCGSYTDGIVGVKRKRNWRVVLKAIVMDVIREKRRDARQRTAKRKQK